jgi:tetrahydromethanopterin S-methyltransferase subunit G
MAENKKPRPVVLTETDFSAAHARLDEIAQEIKQTEEQTGRLEKRSIEYKLFIGQKLTEAKELEYPNGDRVLPHGNFTDWACKKHGWGERYVREHTLIYRVKREKAVSIDTVLKRTKNYSCKAILAALRGKPQGEKRPPKWWIVTGRLPIEAWPEGAEPTATDLLPLVQDWKVRRG